MKNLSILSLCLFCMLCGQTNFLSASSLQNERGDQSQVNGEVQYKGCGCNGGGRKKPNKPLPKPLSTPKPVSSSSVKK